MRYDRGTGSRVAMFLPSKGKPTCSAYSTRSGLETHRAATLVICPTSVASWAVLAFTSDSDNASVRSRPLSWIRAEKAGHCRAVRADSSIAHVCIGRAADQSLAWPCCSATLVKPKVRPALCIRLATDFASVSSASRRSCRSARRRTNTAPSTPTSAPTDPSRPYRHHQSASEGFTGLTVIVEATR